MVAHSPPMRSMSRVCMRSCNAPTSTNSPPVLMPWQIIVITAPCSASGFQAKMPSSTKPRWLTLV